MAEPPQRLAQLRPRQLLLRILEQKDLANAVQRLPPRALTKLIDHFGLEDAGEIVSLATTEQLAGIFDDDLWCSERPGKDETFDADRFGIWLEVMIEVGEKFTARKMAEFDEDLVTLALTRHVLVIDTDALAQDMWRRGHDDHLDQIEKALDSCAYQEFENYRVISLGHGGWDAIAAVLVALDEEHHEFLQRLLERLCAISADTIEDSGGLYRVLTANETLETDVAADREDRRAREGFVAPSAAASFLSLTRTADPREIAASQEVDPLTKAYFRSFEPQSHFVNDDRESPVRLFEVLNEIGILPKAPSTLLLQGVKATPEADESESVFKKGIAELRGREPARYEQLLNELNYLANTLIAGSPFKGRTFRSCEAAEAVLATCNLGLEWLLRRTAAKTCAEDAADWVGREGTVKLFRIGWRLLQENAEEESSQDADIRRARMLALSATGKTEGRANVVSV